MRSTVARFPGSIVTRTIQTVSPGEHGFGLQLGLLDVAPSPATVELLAAVEARRVAAGTGPTPGGIDAIDAREKPEALLAFIAAAGDGQRNEAFIKSALPGELYLVVMCVKG
jgi:hypothetical protein